MTTATAQNDLFAAKNGDTGNGKKPASTGKKRAANGNGGYDESKIKTLSSLEHIRLRTGMYIGRLGDGSDPDDGIYVLLKEVIDNAVDEFITGNGRKVDVRIEDNCVRIRDFGSGIPLGKLVECVSVINTGAKYNDEVYQFSVGLNGVGTKAVNALSDLFRVVAYRKGVYAEALFERGDLKKETKKGKAASEPDGTLVEFHPDPEIFGDFEFNLDFVQRRLWNYACLNSGLSLYLNGQKYESKNGLLDLLGREVGTEDGAASYEPAHYRGDRLEFAFTHVEGYGETYWSFVNGQYTSDGGTHQSAFRE
ncbi:MAG: ATP-binding protein, partial [Candidatus Latescibacterota bacterium]|nr:ATP-binding protein [Candidatus Latescibacterota bacterium]